MKKIYEVTGNPWIDNDLRMVETQSDRLSQSYLIQHEDGGRMPKRVKDEYREVVQPLVREAIANILRVGWGL